MHSFPSISILAVLLGAFLSFAWGGLYWGVFSTHIAKAVHLDADTRNMPPAALVIAFITRVVSAFGLAAILAFAGVSGLGMGALGGAVIFCLFLLPMMLGQAAFGPPFGSWPRVAVGLPEALVGFAIMGAFGTLWR